MKKDLLNSQSDQPSYGDSSNKKKLEDIVIQSFITSKILLDNLTDATPIIRGGTIDDGANEAPDTTRVNTLYYTIAAAGCRDEPFQCKTYKDQLCEDCIMSRNNMYTGYRDCPHIQTNQAHCNQSVMGYYCTNNTHEANTACFPQDGYSKDKKKCKTMSKTPDCVTIHGKAVPCNYRTYSKPDCKTFDFKDCDVKDKESLPKNCGSLYVWDCKTIRKGDGICNDNGDFQPFNFNPDY